MNDPKGPDKESEPESTEDLLSRLSREAEEMQREGNISSIPALRLTIKECDSQIKELQTKLDDLAQQLKKKKSKEKAEKVWYFLPLLIIIIFTGYLIKRGLTEPIKVAINFNVGEIIGGVLIGVGALIAGAAYAFRRPRGDQS